MGEKVNYFPDDLECLEKALRGDKRFEYLFEEHKRFLWGMFRLLEENDLYQSYLGPDAFKGEYLE